jgi:TolB-like protein/Tfp pilus assembly protein PilF
MEEPHKAVFLSYASQDSEAAKRICESLRAAGVGVWFDQNELRGGDAWDQRLRRHIQDCALFIPIISEHTQARAEGYFRLEWDLADQRTHMVSRNRAFIIPVCLDATPENRADVPETFVKVQWTRLGDAETLAKFCERIKALLNGPLAQEGATETHARAQHDSSRRTRWRWPRVISAVALAAAGLASLYFAFHAVWPEAFRQKDSDSRTGTAAHGQSLPQSDERSIAVLPFINLSADPGQAFLSDGIAEEILNLLANVPGLRVTSRTSSFSFRNRQIDLRTIAKHLGVNYIVEGSVQSAGGRVHVTAQLIDVGSDAQLLSRSYERQLDDVFTIQSDVAGQVVHALKIAIGADEATSLGNRPTRNIEAWQLFLKAREQMLGRTSVADLQGALSNVEAAIEQDPGFARAHSLRAMTVATLISWEQDAQVEGVEAERAAERKWANALQSATRALQLDPRLGEPYAVRALYAITHNEFSDANKNLNEALVRAPGNADAHNWYGQFLLSAGYLSNGFAEARRAAALDPLSPVIAWNAAFAGLVCNHAEVVQAYSARAQEIGWTGPEPAALRGGAAMAHGDLDQAEKIFLEALPSRGMQIRASFAAIRRHRIDPPTRAMLDTLVAYGPPGLARFAVEARVPDVNAMLATLDTTVAKDSLLAPDGSGGPARISSIHASDNFSVLASDWWMPMAAPMRHDPRFVRFLRDIGLVKFWRGNGWPDLCGPVGDVVVCR